MMKLKVMNDKRNYEWYDNTLPVIRATTLS